MYLYRLSLVRWRFSLSTEIVYLCSHFLFESLYHDYRLKSCQLICQRHTRVHRVYDYRKQSCTHKKKKKGTGSRVKWKRAVHATKQLIARCVKLSAIVWWMLCFSVCSQNCSRRFREGQSFYLRRRQAGSALVTFQMCHVCIHRLWQLTQSRLFTRVFYLTLVLLLSMFLATQWSCWTFDIFSMFHYFI